MNMPDYATARTNMVDGQIRPNRVTDPAVIEAFRAVPRELFVPPVLRGSAYVDEDLPLGGGRHLMEPRVFGRLLNEAHIGRDDTVLDVGCATGYSAAMLARLAGTVVAVESDPALAQQASALLTQLGAANASVVIRPLDEGEPARGPYQVILLEGAVAEVPRRLLDQLADRGRLLAVVGGTTGRMGMGKAMLYQRTGTVVSPRELFDAAVPLLPGFAPRPAFEF